MRNLSLLLCPRNGLNSLLPAGSLYTLEFNSSLEATSCVRDPFDSHQVD